MKRFYLEDTQAYIQHCQEDPSWQLHILGLADKACGNTFVFTDKYEMERCVTPVTLATPIDWDHIPFGDEEWCFALSRLTFLTNLAMAYAATGKEDYRDAWIRLFMDFQGRNKRNEVNSKRSWRSLECGIRVSNIIRSVEFFEDTKPLPADVMSAIDDFFAEHVSWLMESHTAFHRLSNWGVLQDHGLLAAGLWLDDRKAVMTALSRLEEEVHFQTMEDGTHWEQSTMYHAEVLDAALDSILIARRFDIPLPLGLVTDTHRLAKGLAAMLRPDGYSHLFGDSDLIDMRDLVAKAAVLFNDGTLTELAKDGLDPSFWASFPLDTKLPAGIPQDRSTILIASGNAILSLSKDDEVRFHCGFYGSGHGHFDQLHFDLWHKGDEVISDCGRGTYVDGPDRRALKGTKGHNTVMVDGEEMAVMLDSWGVADYADPFYCIGDVSGRFKWVEGAHKGYLKKGVLPTRLILALDDKYLIVFDYVSSTTPVKLESFLHIGSGWSVENDSDDMLTLSKDGDEISLAYFDADGQTSISTWPVSERYNEYTDCPMITRTTTCDGRVINAAVFALKDTSFVVRRADVVKPLSGTVLDEGDAMGLVIDDGTDSYTVAYAPHEIPTGGLLLSCEGADCYAKLFVKHGDGPVIALKR